MHNPIKIIDASSPPPFVWVNQWPHVFCCCELDPISVRFSRGRAGGLHMEFVVVLMGLGFVWAWYDRVDRARYLAFADQAIEMFKDHVREEQPGVVFEGDDE